MPTVNRIDEGGREGGLFDFLMYKPYGKGPILTDDEAQTLYNLWKTSKPGERKFVPASKGEIISLKAKGYLSGATEVELTDRGRKVIVEMVTREPSALEKSSDPPPYSKIKTMANRRPRQTFVEKKAGREANPFNLKAQRQAMRKEAGLWDLATSPFKDWWSNTKDRVGDWFTEQGAHVGNARELYKAVQREKVIADRNLKQVWQQAQSAGGVAPATLSKAIERLVPVMEAFRNEVGRVVPIPDFPPGPDQFATEVETSPGVKAKVITAQSFMNFYNMLSAAMAPMIKVPGWNSVLLYEKNKAGAPMEALKIPKGPEDQSFNNEFNRVMGRINRQSPTAAPIIDKDTIKNILTNYNGTGKKLVDVMTEAVMRVGGVEYIDNEASEIASWIEGQLREKLNAHRNFLKGAGGGSASPPGEIYRWDNEINQIDAALFQNVKAVMNQKFARMFGGQAPKQERSRGPEMAV